MIEIFADLLHFFNTTNILRKRSNFPLSKIYLLTQRAFKPFYQFSCLIRLTQTGFDKFRACLSILCLVRKKLQFFNFEKLRKFFARTPKLIKRATI